MYSLIVLQDTWLKRSPIQSAKLVEHNAKFAVTAELELPLDSFALFGDHLKIALGKDSQGNQISFGGINTWYAYQPHVGVQKDGKPVQIIPVLRSNSIRRQINILGLSILKSFEGCELESYLCPAGVWTIGYGHTSGVVPGQSISRREAEELLARELMFFEELVTRLVQVPTTNDQFSALVSFAYNVGGDALAGSTLLRLLNWKDYAMAAEQFLRWNKAGKVELPGLTRRRNAERSLFLSQDFSEFL